MLVRRALTTMRCSLHSGECVAHQSSVHHSSKTMPGVSFSVRKMSFGQRLELARRIREIAQKLEYASAGEAFADRVEASLLSMEIERLYLEWGTIEVNGLEIDGQAASIETLVSSGPEELCREIVQAVRHECGLNEDERKN